MMHLGKQKRHFYGTTTLGEKGQVVIPAEARSALKLKKGEKLLVFGIGGGILALTKLEQLESFAAHLAQRLNTLKGVIKRAGRVKK